MSANLDPMVYPIVFHMGTPDGTITFYTMKKGVLAVITMSPDYNFMCIALL